MKNERRGWGQPGDDTKRKWHYFINGRSLCDDYAVGDLYVSEQHFPEHKDNCARCKRAFKKQYEIDQKLKKWKESFK